MKFEQIILAMSVTISSLLARSDDDALQMSLQYTEDSRVSAGEGIFVATSQTRLAVPVGMRQTRTGFWFTGAQFTQTLLTYHSGSVGENRLYRLAFPIDYVHSGEPSSDWQFMARLEPAHYSDERVWDHRASQLEYEVCISYQYTPDLNIVFGTKLDRRLGKAQRYLIGGIEWQQADRLWHQWVFPDWKSEYQWNRRTHFFAHVRPTGGEWRVGKYDNHQRMQYVNWAMGIGGRYQTSSPYSLRIEIGQNRWRKVILPSSTLSPSTSWFWLASIEALL